MKPLFEFLADPDLFGATFAGPSYSAWRTVAKILDGLPLDAGELELYRAITGRDAPPSEAFTEAYIIKPRRAGGTQFAAALALHSALTDQRAKLGPGEVSVTALIAVDRRQARQALGYVKGLIAGSPMIAAEVTSETRESIEFRHAARLEIHTASFRSTRGFSFAAVVLDEMAFFRSDESANPDTELVRAVRPGLANLGGRLLGLSSPHAKRGHLYEMHREHFGKDSDVLVLQASHSILNPTISQKIIDRAMREDPIAARSEWFGEFRSDVSQFLDDELVDQAIVERRRELPARAGVIYRGFVDPSGGRHDAMTFGIAHAEGERIVLDRLLVRAPPFAPERVVAEFAAVAAEFGLSSVTGDAYAGEWVVAAFSSAGLRYEPAEADKSSIFLETLPLFTQDRLELLDVPVLSTQLRLLERKPRANGRADLVDHPPRGNDDAANAALGAAWLVARQAERQSVIDPELAIAATQRPAPDVRFAPRILGAVVDGDRLQIARRLGRLALAPMSETGNPLHLAGLIAAEASRWTAFAIYVADSSPGQPVLAALRSLGYSVFAVDLFGDAYRGNFGDLRTELAFKLADWLPHASVPAALLHDLSAIGFTTRRGTPELLESAIGVVDALAVTLLDRSSYQDPRTVMQSTNITRAISDDGRYGGSTAPRPASGLVRPYHLGDLEPSLERDGWSRCLPAEEGSRSLTDYDVLSRD